MKFLTGTFELLTKWIDSLCDFDAVAKGYEQRAWSEYKTKERTITEGDERLRIDVEQMNKDFTKIKTDLDNAFNDLLGRLKEVENNLEKVESAYDKPEVEVVCVNCKSTSKVSKHAALNTTIHCNKCNGGRMYPKM